jgi:hypothetical protein
MKPIFPLILCHGVMKLPASCNHVWMLVYFKTNFENGRNGSIAKAFEDGV